jgi:hypothetical protein
LKDATNRMMVMSLRLEWNVISWTEIPK